MTELDAVLAAIQENQAAQWSALQTLMRNIERLAIAIDQLQHRLTMQEAGMAITEMHEHRILH